MKASYGENNLFFPIRYYFSFCLGLSAHLAPSETGELLSLDLPTDLSLVESRRESLREAPAGLSEQFCKIWGNVLDKILTHSAVNP